MIYDPCEECDPKPETKTKITCDLCKYGKAQKKIKELKIIIKQLKKSLEASEYVRRHG